MKNQRLNVISHLKNDLAKFNYYKYVTPQGYFKRHNIERDLRNYDKELIFALLNDDLIKSTYIKNVNGINILQIDQLIDLMTYSSYLPNSYTKYADIIGLTVNNNYLFENSDVVLNFPYKDTVIKGSMTKNYQCNTPETFLNNVIAKPEIDELFEPKIFSNVYKYDKNGRHCINTLNYTDNLMLKGNNLVALYSLLPKYSGQIKLIYIDPPYNTGNDSFNYNDNFNQSTWLVFMKNRLIIGKQLLCDNGSIFISCDDNEQAYLKVLCDEIFGKDNFIANITIVSNRKGNQGQLGFAYTNSYVLVYSKNRNSVAFNDIALSANDIKSGNWEKDNVGYYKKGENIKASGPSSRRNDRPNLYYPVFISKDLKSIHLKRHSYSDIKLFPRTNGNDMRWYWKKDTMRNNILNHNIIIKETRHGYSLYKKQRPNDYNIPKRRPKTIFDNPSYSTGHGTNEIIHLFGKKIFNYPKPEELIRDLISIGSNKNDIVLDFFSGSATTQAVAMKMHRRFIGVEQMDYIDTISIPRLQKVINGEQGGISKSVNWQGGGSFIYAKLMTKNQKYVDKIKKSQNLNELIRIFTMMRFRADFNLGAKFNYIQNILNDNNTSLQNKKDMLIGTLDVNQLYYNAHNIDDNNVRKLLSDSDYRFNKTL